MSADILPFKHPRKAECDREHCTKPMIKAMMSNSPAYCSYRCGAMAQPEHAASAMHGTPDGMKR